MQTSNIHTTGPALLAAIGAAILFCPAGAGAATITRSGTVVTYTAAAGEANDLAISRDAFGHRLIEGENIPIVDADPAAGGCGVVVTDPPGPPDPYSMANCPAALGVTKLIVNAGDGEDTVSAIGVTTGGAGLEIDGGTGNDELTGGTFDDRLVGGAGADSLRGGAGADSLMARDGGNDPLLDCGPGGADSVKADTPPNDASTSGCEAVLRPAIARVDLSPNNATVTYEASPGQSNEVVIERLNLAGNVLDGYIRITDTGDDADGGPIEVATPASGNCVEGPASNQATCGAAVPTIALIVLLDDGDDSVIFEDDLANTKAVAHGGSGNDDLSGTSREDTLYGENGHDVLRGLDGPDGLHGGAGTDTLNGGGGGDALFGGTGDFDFVDYSGETVPVVASADDAGGDGPTGEQDNIGADVEVLLGGSADDTLIGNERANVIVGGDGDDSLIGLDGSDVLIEDASSATGGNDDLHGGPGGDLISGGQGDDRLGGGSGPDALTGGDGRDKVDYSTSLDAVSIALDGSPSSGSSGEGDTLAADIEGALGGQGDDLLAGNALDNDLEGGLGEDRLIGAAGSDHLAGDDGDDLLEGGAGPDSFAGGSGKDEVTYAASGAGVVATLDEQPNDGVPGEGDAIDGDIEILRGGPGNDTLGGNDAANSLIGNLGDDAISAGGGIDLLSGGDGNDTLAGGEGNDNLQAGSGNDGAGGEGGADVVAGGSGDDQVSGGAGGDNLSGGAGRDGLLARDGVLDVISCGGAGDSVDGDSIDQLAADCSPEPVLVAAATISSARLKLSRKGTLSIALRCRATGVGCSGKLTLSRTGRKKLKFGEKAFSVASGRQAMIVLKVSKAARRALARTGRMNAVATASVAGGKPVVRTVAVTASKRKGKRR